MLVVFLVVTFNVQNYRNELTMLSLFIIIKSTRHPPAVSVEQTTGIGVGGVQKVHVCWNLWSIYVC